MYHRLVVVAAVVGLSASCTVQPTPREYIDRQIPIDVVRQDAETQLSDRIAVLVQALQAGDAEAAEAALSPAQEVLVIGPGGGEHFVGAAQVRAILDLFAATGEASIELQDLDVQATPRATAAWFAARLELRRPGLTEPVPLRVTGIYVEREAVWELQHAHFSVPVDALTRLSPPAEESSPAEAG